VTAISTGTLLEDVAITHLQKNNLLILHRNFRCKTGEIDVIAKDQSYLVFIEVRYRANDLHGSAAESVTKTKQQNISRTAQFYIQTRRWAQNVNCRFDVVAISGAVESPKIEWIKDAFNE